MCAVAWPPHQAWLALPCLQIKPHGRNTLYEYCVLCAALLLAAGGQRDDVIWAASPAPWPGSLKRCMLARSAALMSDVYEDHKDEDGFLYITYSGENTFGC